MDKRIIRLFDVEALATAMEADVNHRHAVTCHAVCTDSRKVQANDLFLALRGEHFDAHDFLSSVVEAGCRAVVVERTVDLPDDVVVFRVDSVEKAFGRLARAVIEKRRSMGNFVTYGLTGSNGKTTTKELLAALLAAKGRCVLKTEGNHNNFIGLPMTALELTEAHDVAIFEMGANALGEIRYLSNICQPEKALITGVGAAHLGGFGSLEGVAHAKGELIASPRLKHIVLPHETRGFYENHLPDGLQVDWVGEDEAFHPEHIVSSINGVDFDYCDDKANKQYAIHLPLLGGHNARNLSSALTLVRDEGWTADEINAAVRAIRLPSGRLERWDAKDNVCFLHDAYNANPSSMKEALALMAQVVDGAHRCFVLGDMRELGKTSDALHRDIGKRVALLGAKCLLCVGDSAKAYAAGALDAGMDNEKIVCTPQNALSQGLDWLDKRLSPSDVCLIKGSRGVRLERVIDFFGATRHEA
ncbi:MAG: UDP-N-acetylmuramoyl-tripeptide--D-alanyl-D-alanine ligase [Proteobacteria bacterium]|nr:UDP-N-acetylmuramoyl-tripeptide--D-alanyl-D-alanine ligase [Pseudomonadota bacterium]